MLGLSSDRRLVTWGPAVGPRLKEIDVTAAKRAPAPAPKKPAPAAKKPTVATKKSASSSKKVAPKKAAAKKPAAEDKRTASTTKKVAPKKAIAAKKPASEAKRTASTTKKVAPKKAAAAKKPAAVVKKTAPAPPRRPTVGPYAKEAKFLEEQRQLLFEERSIYSGQAVDLRAEADSLALEREPGDVQFDEESGEGGTVTVDRERNLALSAQASAAVEEIDDALRKIERKTYGGCERCYQAIPKARLRALPFARLCVACKSGGLSRR
jgi:DnaK suppressor protein